MCILVLERVGTEENVKVTGEEGLPVGIGLRRQGLGGGLCRRKTSLPQSLSDLPAPKGGLGVSLTVTDSSKLNL